MAVLGEPDDARQAPPAGAAARRVHTLGKYRLIAELARGGMGVVYLALTRGPGSFSKLLVLKELKPELVDDRNVVEMFMEEARLAACLSHPNVVQTVDAGSDEHRHFIAMEYLEGQPLHRVLSRARRAGNPLSFEFQATVLCHALEGLAYAHTARDYEGTSLDIVHRDVSPHNVFIGYDGRVKVLDFGIAKAVNSAHETRTGIVKGKLAYMAPEQAAGGPIDARADLFSVGIMIWEAATGLRFWGTDNDGQILRALLCGGLDTAHRRGTADLPDDLRAIVSKATSLDATARHASASGLLGELRSALARRGGPLATAELGGVVSDMFEEHRTRLQAAIEEAMGHCRGPASGKFAVSGVQSLPAGLDVPSLNLAVGEESLSRVPVLSQATSVSSSGSPAVSKEADTRPSRSHPWALGLLGASVLGGLVAAGSVSLLRRSPAPTPTSRVVAMAPSPMAPSPMAPPPMAPSPSPGPDPVATVHLAVRAFPADARIFIDHALLDNPTAAVVPKNGAVHGVRVEADGYLPQDHSFEASGDATLVIALEPRRAPTHAVATPVRARPASVAATTSTASPPVSAPTVLAPIGVVPQRRINANNPYTH